MVFFVSTSRGFKVELGRELERNHCEFVTTKLRLMSSTLSTVLELAYRTVHFVSPVDRRSDAIRRDPSPVRVAAPRVVAGRACNFICTETPPNRTIVEFMYLGTTVRTPGPGVNSSNPGWGVHALWLSAPHAPTPPPGFIRDVQPSTIRPSKHTEKSVSPSVVFAAARTDAACPARQYS